jgi:hypothetical protein
MRFSSPTVCAMLAAALMAGCSGNMGSTNSSMPNTPQSTQTHGSNVHFSPLLSRDASLIPVELRPQHSMKLRGPSGGITPDSAHMSYGLYVSQFYATDILAYMTPNTANNGPKCSVSPASNVNDVANDNGGDLIDPDGGTHTIIVYSGPKLCGSELGSINDPYGIPSDASSVNARHGNIAVANIYSGISFQGPAAGSISVCSLSGGCTSNLTNANMFEVAGVVMASNGDCWADSEDSSGTAWLTYFAGCTGSGQTATGFENGTLGGLDIDKDGHILAIDAYNANLYVYSGCNPTCTLVNGPQALWGQTIFGHLSRSSMEFAGADFQNGEIDMYKYEASSGKIKYEYSFNNGLSASNLVEGAAFNPRSHQ